MNPASPVRVIVVDNTDYGIALLSACEHAGWIADLCTHAHAAFDVARHDPLDAAIISIRLADNRGDAVLYRIAALQPHLRYRTVLLTTNEADARIAKITGCFWVAKRNDPSLVMNLVRRHLPVPV